MSGAEFKAFARDLRVVAEGVEALVEEGLERVGKGALASAEAKAPRDTGELAESLRLRKQGPTAVVLEATARHAPFQEFGTSVMAPQPYVGPAFEEWSPRLVKEIEGVADEIARRL